MDKVEYIRKELFQSVLGHVRERYPEEIEKAYEYFFEEEYPGDFLTGIALDMAFINFEDFLICDYRVNDEETFIDLYIRDMEDLKGEDKKILKIMKESVISLYEIKSADEGNIMLEDLVLGGGININGNILSGLNAGDILGTRFFHVDDEFIMSGCGYPYSWRHKEKVLGYLDKQFKRYIKHKKPEGTIKGFLKDEAYIFNSIWVNNLFKGS